MDEHDAPHDRPDVPELAPLATAGPRARRTPWARMALVSAVAVATYVVVDDAPDDGEEVVVDDPTPDDGDDGGATTLELAGPRDGRDSMQLPFTVTPAEGLSPGDVVAVAGEGFEPGESLGVVTCAAEAMAPVSLGVDACEIGTVTYVDADADGRLAATYEIRRTVTSPAFGTVDCASAPGRCVVAAGALSDYDRSGGAPVTLGGDLDPVEIPVLVATPSEGLRDGDVVTLTGPPLGAGVLAHVQQCSFDPRVCTSVGDEGAPVGDALELALTVRRFLPGPTPGTFVDCALSPCVLSASFASGSLDEPAHDGVTPTTVADTDPVLTSPPPSPAPVALSFVADDAVPPSPTATGSPTTVAAGDVVVVAAEGLEPGAGLHALVCRSIDEGIACAEEQPTVVPVDADGTATLEVAVPDDACVLAPTVAACGDDGGELQVLFSPYGDSLGHELRAVAFPPPPIPLTVRE